MEKDLNKNADIAEEAAAVNAAADSSKEAAVKVAVAGPQLTDSDISQQMLPQKKTRGTAAKIVVLALCCSLVGSAAGAGGVIAVDRFLIGRNMQIVNMPEAGPEMPAPDIGNDAAQAQPAGTSDKDKLKVIEDRGTLDKRFSGHSEGRTNMPSGGTRSNRPSGSSRSNNPSGSSRSNGSGGNNQTRKTAEKAPDQTTQAPAEQ
jgi:hypothetical protein